MVEVKNISPDPETSFEMDPEEALPYFVDGTVAATWHTHPGSDPALSGEDYETFRAWPDLKHTIIGHRDGTVAVLTYEVEDGLVLACD